MNIEKNNKLEKFAPLLLTVSSTLFLAGGWVYYRIFLLHFGINSNAFFSLSDYVAASIDFFVFIIPQIILALFLIYVQTKEGILSQIVRCFIGLSILLDGIIFTISFVNPTALECMGPFPAFKFHMINTLMFFLTCFFAPLYISKNQIMSPILFYSLIFTFLYFIMLLLTAITTANYTKSKKISIDLIP